MQLRLGYVTAFGQLDLQSFSESRYNTSTWTWIATSIHSVLPQIPGRHSMEWSLFQIEISVRTVLCSKRLDIHAKLKILLRWYDPHLHHFWCIRRINKINCFVKLFLQKFLATQFWKWENGQCHCHCWARVGKSVGKSVVKKKENKTREKLSFPPSPRLLLPVVTHW